VLEEKEIWAREDRETPSSTLSSYYASEFFFIPYSHLTFSQLSLFLFFLAEKITETQQYKTQDPTLSSSAYTVLPTNAPSDDNSTDRRTGWILLKTQLSNWLSKLYAKITTLNGNCLLFINSQRDY
jgi:hypothetical protein